MLGDILGIFVLSPSIRATTYFAFNPKRLILDPIQGKIDGGYELVESIQYIVSKVLDDDECDQGSLVSEKDVLNLVQDGTLTIGM